MSVQQFTDYLGERRVQGVPACFQAQTDKCTCTLGPIHKLIDLFDRWAPAVYCMLLPVSEYRHQIRGWIVNYSIIILHKKTTLWFIREWTKQELRLTCG